MKTFDTKDRWIIALDRYDTNSRIEVVDHFKERPTPEGVLAMSLVERWGMISVIPSPTGDVVSGQWALMEPEAVVARAVETAERLTAALRDKGWVIECPSPEEIYEQP